MPDSPWTTDTRTSWDSDQYSSSPSSPNTISTQILDPVDGFPSKKLPAAHTAGMFPFTFPMGSLGALSTTRSTITQEKFHGGGYSPLSIVTSPLPRAGRGFGLFFQPSAPNSPSSPQQPSPTAISAPSPTSSIHSPRKARRRSSQVGHLGTPAPPADSSGHPELDCDDLKTFSIPQYRQNTPYEPSLPDIGKDGFFLQIFRHFTHLGKLMTLLVRRLRER